MTMLFASSFDHYGGPAEFPGYRNSNSDGGWSFDGSNGSDPDNTILGDVIQNEPALGSNNNHSAYGSYRLEAPAFGARRGDLAFCADQVNISRFSFGGTTYAIGGQEAPRFTIPGASELVRIIHVAFACDALPQVDAIHGHIFSFQNSGGEILGYLGVNPSGRLVIWDGGAWSSAGTNVESKPTALAISAAPVIAAETWASLSIKLTTNASDNNCIVQIYSGDIVAANLVMDTTVAFTAPVGTHNVDILGLLPPPLVGQNGVSTEDPFDTTKRYIRDLVVCNTSGSYNNDHLGQVFVAAQQMRAEDAGGGWEAFPRENKGTGVLDHTAGTGLRVPDDVDLSFGSGDFTVEGDFKVDLINTAPNTTILMSKWDETNDEREWKLEYDDADGRLKWIVSTDGIAETVVFTYPWVPTLQKYHTIAVSRNTAVTRVFVDGVQIGMDQADANTYHTGTANVGIMSRYDGTTVDSDTATQGWADEIRITKGVGRYTANYTPATGVFGRDVGADASYNSVALLLGFDGNFTDDSPNALTLVAGSNVTTILPDDDGNSYEVLNQRPAWDDSYIEARNTFASNILELSGQPLNNETVVLGSQTYTFKTTLTPTAYEVLIGTDARDSLEHLVAAVNAGDGVGTDYATGTVANTDIFAEMLPDEQAKFTATTIGTAGNSEPSTETLTNGAFLSGATLAGGEDIPSPSDFAMERLPVDVTGVLALQVTARGYKSDAGSANLRFDLKGPSATVDVGTAQGTTLNPAWLREIFEEDPDTSVGITPSTITGGRVRVTRTA